MNQQTRGILSYATPSPRPRRPRRCLGTLWPYVAGLAVGSSLIGWIVCYPLKSCIVAIADSPSGPDAAMGMWILFLILAIPPVIATVLAELFVIAAVRRVTLAARPSWVCFLYGMLYPLVAVAVAIRSNGNVYHPYYVDLRIAFAAGVVLILLSPLALVRRAAIPNQ